ncbi:MAG: RHS repeat-associated core domain-containing protein, partial [Fibromonadaceae bacterium]|nr:RHS repeat-associated core domain-containing protein [Fibromonadaceae bacterium]
SAYAYYPYGTVQELSADGDADRSRWQAKEWDEEYGKYYFGSRFFDPYFGLWISPDPAGQFANPYTYGGDPVNYVDPDGEFAHIIFGAIVGAVGGAVHCGITEANCTRSILAGTAIGAAAAATGGAVGGAVGGAIAKAGGSATAAAIGGGAAGGAAGGAVSGVGNYATQGGDLSLGGFGKAAGFGALSGGIGGGVGGAISSPGWSRLASGFTSGAVGSAMDGGDFWDIVAGGAIGAGTAFAFTMLEIALISDLQYYEQLQEKQFTYTDPMEPTEAMINAFEHFKTFDAQVSAPESYALYNSKGEYIKGTGARGKYVNKDDQIYAAVKPTKIAKFRMSFSSGYHSIHSHNVSHEPSSQDSDLSLHKRYVKTNHYVYWRKGNNFHKYEGYKVTPMIGY